MEGLGGEINTIKKEKPEVKIGNEIKQVKMNIDSIKAGLERASEFPEDKKERAMLMKKLSDEEGKLEDLLDEQKRLIEMEEYRRLEGGGNA